MKKWRGLCQLNEMSSCIYRLVPCRLCCRLTVDELVDGRRLKTWWRHVESVDDDGKGRVECFGDNWRQWLQWRAQVINPVLGATSKVRQRHGQPCRRDCRRPERVCQVRLHVYVYVTRYNQHFVINQPPPPPPPQPKSMHVFIAPN